MPTYYIAVLRYVGYGNVSPSSQLPISPTLPGNQLQSPTQTQCVYNIYRSARSVRPDQLVLA